MKEKDIWYKWNEFINDDKYKKYFKNCKKNKQIDSLVPNDNGPSVQEID